MTIRVTLQQNGKCTRKEYRTHKRAVLSIKRWFAANNGIAMVYQPGKLPVVYRNQYELPEQAFQSKTNFYRTKAWLTLRVRVLAASDGRCKLCGISAEAGVSLHVDHIKPRSQYPELALEESNLQVLCEACNLGKMTSELTLESSK